MLVILVLIICAGVAAFAFQARPVVVLSRWSAASSIVASAVARDEPGAIVAEATPNAEALEAYNSGSQLQDADAQGRVRFFRRDVAGGSIAYFVVALSPEVHVGVINADGATPGSDATGDTIWADGGRHLVPVGDMVRAPYAARDGMELLGAMAFGFHGDARTSDEGTVVIDGKILRVNSGRGVLCITKEGKPEIGLFNAQALESCQQAIGGGPVILWNGKIADPSVSAETGEFVPFNPLGEDFVQLDWRRKIYSGTYPKTAVGIGARPGGNYLVMAVSYGITGVDFAAQLKAMGCSAALGGDDDTSTQAVWRGAPVRDGKARAVPDALAVYTSR